MSVLRDVFGFRAGKHYSGLTDTGLLDALADIVVEHRYSNEAATEAIASEIQKRLADSPQEHSSLIPVARKIADLEVDRPEGFGMGELCGRLRSQLVDRYSANHGKAEQNFRALKLER